MPKTNTVYLLITRFNHADVCSAPLWWNWGKFQTFRVNSKKRFPNLFTVKKERSLAINSLINLTVGKKYMFECHLYRILIIQMSVFANLKKCNMRQYNYDNVTTWTPGWEPRLQKPEAKANIWCSLLLRECCTFKRGQLMLAKFSL